MATAALVWNDISSGTMSASQINGRGFRSVIVELTGQNVKIWWTVDGTDSTATIFGTSDPPWINVIIMDKGDRRAFSDTYLGGPMFEYGITSGFNPYAWNTGFDSGTPFAWYTTIYQQGDPQDQWGGGSGGDPGSGVIAIATALFTV